jgi:cytoskeletal protein CcmA (bactofilin family)
MWKKPKHKQEKSTPQGMQKANSPTEKKQQPEPFPSSQTLPTETNAQSNIGETVYLQGDIEAQENLSIEGQIQGQVKVLEHVLKIGLKGRLKANIYGRVVYIEGSLQGDAYAAEKIVVHKKGKVYGNLVAPRVTVEDGASIHGSIDMNQKTIEEHFPKTKMQTAPAAQSNQIPETSKQLKKEAQSTAKPSASEPEKTKK